MSVFADRRERGRRQSIEQDEIDRRDIEHRDIEHREKATGLTQHGDGTGGEEGSSSGGETHPLSGSLSAADASSLSDVEELARIRLQHSPYRAIRRVGCTFADGVLTLTGVVPTFHYKQLAQTAVANISGVRQVVNLIDVG